MSFSYLQHVLPDKSSKVMLTKLEITVQISRNFGNDQSFFSLWRDTSEEIDRSICKFELCRENI
jgi:hypothetical protein